MFFSYSDNKNLSYIGFKLFSKKKKLKMVKYYFFIK